MTGVQRIKGLVFDKDGTLFDFNASWGAWAQMFLDAELGHDRAAQRALADVMRFDMARGRFHPDSVIIAGTAGEIADLLRPHLQGDVLSRINASAARAPQAEATPLIPFLTDLQARGLRLGVATNDAEAPARAHLGKAGVTGFFDLIAGYDSGHGGKPAPGQLLAFCEITGLAPADCAMVGDSLHDLHAGRAAGMTTIGVLTGPATADDLAPFADVILPSIADIPQWLDGVG